MKKVLFLMAVLLTAISCEKEGEELSTTYTLKCDFESSSIIETRITLFEYNDIDERVGTNTIDVDGATIKQFIANDRSVKIKVYIRMQYGSNLKYLWVQQVYYLDKDKDTVIEITGETMTGNYEP